MQAPVATTTEDQSARRPSRFEVTSVQAPSVKVTESAENDASGQQLTEKRPSLFDSLGIDPVVLQQLSAKPKKSILKKSNAATIHAIDTKPRPGISAMINQISDGTHEHGGTSYAVRNTVTGADTKWKATLETIQSMFKRPSNVTLDQR